MSRGIRFFLVVAMLVGLSAISHAQILFTAALTGAQETPPDTSKGEGTLWAVLGPDMKTLTFRLTYATLTGPATAMHFHVAAPGVPGPVVFPITPGTGNTASGTWTDVPDTIVQDLIRGEIYANVHTAKHPGGEIRGQLTLAEGMGFTISADQSQETPPTGTGGTGTGYAFFENNGQLTYRVTVANLADTAVAAHFHSAPVGVPGPVVHPISFTDSTSQGTWTGFADSIYGLLARNNIYFNIHTKSHPGGEIRGQLMSVTGQRFAIALDGTQETPANTEKGQGTGWAILSPDGSTIDYRATFAELTGPVTGSHFHVAAPGVGGPVVHPVSETTNTTVGTWSSPADSIIRSLLQGNVYLNFHTSAHPGGEIRGQLIPSTAIQFIMGLSSSQESGVVTSGTGTGYALLDSLGWKLIYRVTVAQLSDSLTGAHFHSGAPGVSGPVVQPTPFTDSTSSGTWEGYPTADISGFLDGGFYFNVHTKAHPGGEIRGQMEFAPSVLTSVPQEQRVTPSSFVLAQNYPNPFNPSTVVSFQLPAASQVRLVVYNLLGQEVGVLADGLYQAGEYTFKFDGSRLASGVYFYRLTTAQGQAATKSMLLLK